MQTEIFNTDVDLRYETLDNWILCATCSSRVGRRTRSFSVHMGAFEQSSSLPYDGQFAHHDGGHWDNLPLFRCTASGLFRARGRLHLLVQRDRPTDVVQAFRTSAVSNGLRRARLSPELTTARSTSSTEVRWASVAVGAGSSPRVDRY